MSSGRLKFWGWGREDVVLSPAEVKALESGYAKRFGVSEFPARPVPRAEDITLRKPRVSVPGALADVCSTDHYERLLHSYGKSFFDSARVFARDFSNPPDVVAFPASESDLVSVLDWCDAIGAVAIPYGGGSSVVGGVEPPRTDRPVVTIDLKRLDRVLEIDTTSQAARIQGGVYGPSLEGQLKQSGLTLRHFPQSFEYSSLGGWIATRGGGHYATLYTHIDDFVESLRVVTPSGVLESFRLPGSGAGPSPDRMFIGSEGTLGIITEAWMRLRRRPAFRASTAARFADFYQAAECVRAISQAQLYPANCRLVDADEACLNGAGDGSRSILVITFESADRPQDAPMQRALEIVRAQGGEYDESALGTADAQRQGAAGQWRDAFIRMPYAREVLTPRGVIVETFETAITWDRFRDFHAQVKAATERDPGGDGPSRRGHVPIHAHLSGWAGAVFLVPRGRRPCPPDRPVLADQDRGVGSPQSPGRHDHPSPRGRTRPPPLVRSAAPAAVRRSAARGEEAARSQRHAQSRGAVRPAVSLTYAAPSAPTRRSPVMAGAGSKITLHEIDTRGRCPRYGCT